MAYVIGYLLQNEIGLLTSHLYFSLAPYERRVIELLRNSKDKRARKLAKKRVCFRPYFLSNARHKGLTKYSIARHLWPCQEEGRRAPASHRRVPQSRSLNDIASKKERRLIMASREKESKYGTLVWRPSFGICILRRIVRTDDEVADNVL